MHAQVLGPISGVCVSSDQSDSHTILLLHPVHKEINKWWENVEGKKFNLKMTLIIG